MFRSRTRALAGRWRYGQRCQVEQSLLYGEQLGYGRIARKLNRQTAGGHGLPADGQSQRARRDKASQRPQQPGNARAEHEGCNVGSAATTS